MVTRGQTGTEAKEGRAGKAVEAGGGGVVEEELVGVGLAEVGLEGATVATDMPHTEEQYGAVRSACMRHPHVANMGSGMQGWDRRGA